MPSSEYTSEVSESVIRVYWNLPIKMGGKRFGELEKITGITFFRLSPYEQSPFAGIREASARFLKRCRAEFFFISPPFIISYLLMEWANIEYNKLQRKNPKDYENDT